jgi:hypothetical protein
VHVDGSGYELLPLHCLIDEASVLAAVAVIEVGAESELDARRVQLLPVLATNLLRAGDAQGVRL